MVHKIINCLVAAFLGACGYFLGEGIFSIMKKSGVFITAKAWAFLFLVVPGIFSIIGFLISDFYFSTRLRKQ